jgi:hypothetical protein
VSAARRALAVIALAAALAALGAPRAARADGESPGGGVILFAAADAEPLAARIEAELVAAGLPPRRVTIAGEASPEELAAIVEAAHAEGAIRVEDAASAEVWIVDPATGRTRLRQSLAAEPSPAITAVIALRTVEFLRASLLPAPPPRAPASPAPAAPAAPVAVALATPPPAAAPPRRLRVGLAPAVIASAGGVGAGLSGALTISVPVAARFGVEALGVLPLRPGSLETSEGTSQLSATMGGAGAWLRAAAGGRWSSDVGVGALAAVVRVTGAARAPYVGESHRATGAVPYLRAGASLGLASWLALRADVIVGALLPRVVVESGGRDAASWGRPLGAVLLGLQGGV